MWGRGLGLGLGLGSSADSCMSKHRGSVAACMLGRDDVVLQAQSCNIMSPMTQRCTLNCTLNPLHTQSLGVAHSIPWRCKLNHIMSHAQSCSIASSINTCDPHAHTRPALNLQSTHVALMLTPGLLLAFNQHMWSSCSHHASVPAIPQGQDRYWPQDPWLRLGSQLEI